MAYRLHSNTREWLTLKVHSKVHKYFRAKLFPPLVGPRPEAVARHFERISVLSKS